jgi:hypothetical protein
MKEKINRVTRHQCTFRNKRCTCFFSHRNVYGINLDGFRPVKVQRHPQLSQLRFFQSYSQLIVLEPVGFLLWQRCYVLRVTFDVEGVEIGANEVQY